MQRNGINPMLTYEILKKYIEFKLKIAEAAFL